MRGWWKFDIEKERKEERKRGIRVNNQFEVEDEEEKERNNAERRPLLALSMEKTREEVSTSSKQHCDSAECGRMCM